MNLTEINLREKEFHNKLQSKSKGRFENIFYKALYNMYKDFSTYTSEKSKNKVVLDYGCGIGSITQKIATLKPSKLFGIDISEVSINKAMENAKILNLQINYSVDNCEETKFKNETFDFYTISYGIRNVTNIHQCLKEAFRVLKPGGRFFCLEFSKVENEILNLLYRNYSKLIPLFGKIVVGSSDPYKYLITSIDKFYDQYELVELMKKNKFSNVQFRNLSNGISAIHSGWKI